MTEEAFDYVIVGGGIFGCYAALYLAGRGAKVAILEKEARLFQKASLVNQARLHGGYHYPRSIATAAMSDEHKARFTEEHQAFVNNKFEKFYAVDRYGSFTDPSQFERFCAYLNIPCERVTEHNLFNFNRLEALYRTEEHSFDPVLLGHYYTEKVESHPAIQVYKGVAVCEAGHSGEEWLITLEHSAPMPGPGSFLPANAAFPPCLRTPVVINATYAASNAVNRLFEAGSIALTHEISEIAFINSALFAEKGLTVMDGPFGSIMPYGLSGLLSLSSVAYTHHKISFETEPVFDCQRPETDPSCTPARPGICTECARRPVSNAPKMLAQMQQYFADQVHFSYLFSYFTIKSKLKASHIDDGRPTEIALLREHPKFYCLFAGKINSIYEVEKIA